MPDITHERCEGCKIYNETVKVDTLFCLTQVGDLCPCPQCIIKMVCSHACPKFMDIQTQYLEGMD